MSRKNEALLIENPPTSNDPSSFHDVWKVAEVPLPSLGDKGSKALVRLTHFSVDPYMWKLTMSAKKGDRFGGYVVGQIEETLDEQRLPKGAFITGTFEWVKYFLVTGEEKDFRVIHWEEEKAFFAKHGYGAALGVLGMPGQTAFYGVQKLQLKKDDVLVVSAAAGAVGSFLGQYAKKVVGVQTVIGIAGGAKKTEFVKELGFDFAVDYKVFDTKEKLQKEFQRLLEGKKISAYFDNTGGHILEAAVEEMGVRGRVIVCGQIAYYHQDPSAKQYPNIPIQTIYREIKVEGMLVSFWRNEGDNVEKYFKELPGEIEKYGLQFKQFQVDGWENVTKAYTSLFTGENDGKVFVKL